LLKISDSIRNLDRSDISDNLLYYDYHIKHLLSLIQRGVDKEDHSYLSAYRSFEGEVFENYIFEKLIRYIKEDPRIEHFIVKGPHKKKAKALANALSVNWKGQIVYRTRRNEIGEFDSMIFTKKELYFVEMTLTKSLTNLKKRLRKKKALLETIYPQYEVKALLILNEGVTGIKQLPPYAMAWVTKPFSAEDILHWLSQKQRAKRKPFQQISGKSIVTPEKIDTTAFSYYNSLSWILKKIRTRQESVINLGFLQSKTVTRYHHLYTKIYIGFIHPQSFKTMFPSVKKTSENNIIVALEKDHSGNFILNYFMSHSRKNLDIITVKDGQPNVDKKDPYGVTVTEVAHMLKIMQPFHKLTPKDITAIEKHLPRA